jgi:hypothetical protein
MARRLIELGILVVAVTGACGCSPVRWETDYQAGMQEATQGGKRALVMFSSGMNADCRQMDDEVFSDPAVQELLQKFVLIRVGDMMDGGLAQQFGVTVLPSFFVLRPDVTVAGSHAGKMETEKFRYFLINHSFD